MGLPLYALGVWLAWRVSAPEEAPVSEDPEALDAEETEVTEVPGESESSKNR